MQLNVFSYCNFHLRTVSDRFVIIDKIIIYKCTIISERDSYGRQSIYYTLCNNIYGDNCIFADFYIVVESSLRKHSPNCVNVLRQAYKSVHSMLADKLNRQKLENIFKYVYIYMFVM